MFDWDQYKGNLKWLRERTIYITLAGSHSYGTNIASSDIDIRGVFVAPKEYYLGFNSKIEQVECKDPDLTFFEIRKFVELAANCNPNIIELLFTDSKDHLLVTPAWQVLQDNRNLFLTQKAKHTFSGYAISQLNRIKLHRQYLLHPVEKQPTREEFGLPNHTVIPRDQLEAANAAIKKQIDIWNWKELDDLEPALRQAVKTEFYNKLTEITGWAAKEVEGKIWLSAANKLGINSNFLELLDMERRYQAKLNEWRSYQNWKANRNPKRAEMEAKFGYDAKHAMHLVRLCRICSEILTEGVVWVKRPDAAELIAIRNGAWSYEKLIEWAAQQEAELDTLIAHCKLPKAPDRKKIDQLCISIVERML